LNLIIDIGNSRSKVAIFSQHELVATYFFEELTVKNLSTLMIEFPGTAQAILSTVASVHPSVYTWLKSTFSCFVELNARTPMPLLNNYQTPETLGLDRLAAAIGARVIFPDQELLVIDAGTAVTFDLIEGNGTFAGGNISPGLRSRFRALHEYTRNLPLVEQDGQVPLIGRTTEEAIKAGVINGMILEMDGMIDMLRKKYAGLQPVLTGGDAPFFERRLKNPIFVKFGITLIGLNRILEYNVEKQ
jgi:type III pantothenate kinase